MFYLANILITAIVAITATIGAYNYLPLSFIEKFGPEKPLGATITTIAATDTIKSSRAVINTNFSNLNSDKTEVSSSSIAAITTLSNLVTVGNLTSGSLGSGFTTVTVPRGGTGSTTLSSNQVLLGNGTGDVQVVSGLGSSGQFLTSGGAGTPPTWATSSFDEAANHTLTGTWNFKGTTSVASTTAGQFNVGSIVSTSTAQFTSVGIGIATTTSGQLEVTGDIQIGDDLIIGGECSGCPGVYDASSTVFSVSTGTTTYASNIPTTSNTGLGFFRIIDGGGGGLMGSIIIRRTGLTEITIGTDNDTSIGGNNSYSFQWSGASLLVGENTDTGTDANITGTIYWYR